jgi:hypothetical protein
MGLQKWKGCDGTESMVKSKWWAVIVHPTLSGRDLT